MLVARHIPADDEEIHPPVAELGEVGHRLAVTREDSETEIFELPGRESRGPRAQEVTLAGDGQSTGSLDMIVVVTEAVPTVVMGHWRGATHDCLAEVDPEAEQRNQASDQGQQWNRGSHLPGPGFSSVKHVWFEISV
jgi:hypothetical protein